MNLLPKWVLTKGLPASEDVESFTAMEMTYKLYQAMNELITDYNKFVDDTNKSITDFVNQYNQDWEVWTTSFRQEFQDFIDTVELTIANLDVDISPELNALKEEMIEYTNNAIASIKIETDSELSETSENPVANKVVTLALKQKAGSTELEKVKTDSNKYTDTKVAELKAEILGAFEEEY